MSTERYLAKDSVHSSTHSSARQNIRLRNIQRHWSYEKVEYFTYPNRTILSGQCTIINWDFVNILFGCFSSKCMLWSLVSFITVTSNWEIGIINTRVRPEHHGPLVDSRASHVIGNMCTKLRNHFSTKSMFACKYANMTSLDWRINSSECKQPKLSHLQSKSCGRFDKEVPPSHYTETCQLYFFLELISYFYGAESHPSQVSPAAKLLDQVESRATKLARSMKEIVRNRWSYSSKSSRNSHTEAVTRNMVLTDMRARLLQAVKASYGDGFDKGYIGVNAVVDLKESADRVSGTMTQCG